MKKYRTILAVVVIIVIWAIFYNVKGIFTHGIFPIINDTLQYFWPESFFYSFNLGKNILPLWNPFIEFGESLVGRSFVVFFSPLNLLLGRFFSFEVGWTLGSAVPVLLGAIGAFLLARLFTLSLAASLLAGLAYLNGGIMQTQFYFLPFSYSIAVLPWILFSTEYMLKKRVVSGFFFLAISFAVLFLCANPQYIFYNMIAFAMYFFIRARVYCLFSSRVILKNVVMFSLLSLLALGIAVCIGLIQILLTYDTLLESRRLVMAGAVNYEESLTPLCFLLHLLPSCLSQYFFTVHTVLFKNYSWLTNPSLFVGVVPAILSVPLFFGDGEKLHKNLIYALMAIFFMGWFIASAQYNFLYTLIFSRIPLAGVFRIPARALFMSHLSLAVLGGIGFDYLVSQDRQSSNYKERYAIIIILAAGLTLFGFFYAGQMNLTAITIFTALANLWLLLVFILGYYWEKKRALLLGVFLIFALLFYQLLFILGEKANNPSLGATENQFEFQSETSLLTKPHEAVRALKEDQTLFRIAPLRVLHSPVSQKYDMGFGHISLEKTQRGTLSLQLIPMTWGQVFQISSIGHYDQGYHSFMSPTDSSNLVDLCYRSILENSDKSVLDMANVKYVLTNEELNHPKLKLFKAFKNVFPGESAPKLFETGPVYIYRNDTVWPRIFLASEIVFMKHDQTLKYLNNNILRGQTAIVHNQELTKLNQSSNQDQLEIQKYGILEIELEANTARRVLLVVSDHFDRGWRCFVNGKEVEGYRVNYAFRGLPLPAGKSRIAMKYLPNSYTVGLRFMAFGLAILMFAAFILKRILPIKPDPKR